MLASRVTSNGSFAMVHKQALHTAQHRHVADTKLYKLAPRFVHKVLLSLIGEQYCHAWTQVRMVKFMVPVYMLCVDTHVCRCNTR